MSRRLLLGGMAVSFGASAAFPAPLLNLGALPSWITDDMDIRHKRSHDWGGTSVKVPALVAVPATEDEVARTVVFALENGLTLSIRGGGHSQVGQSLVQDGLMLDTFRLKDVKASVDEMKVEAGGGAMFGEIAWFLKDRNVLPAVMPDWTSISMGGLVAAGGMGVSNWKGGTMVDHVLSMTVIDGTGERHDCSPTENADVFHAVIGGQGQFGIILSVTMALRQAGSMLTTATIEWPDVDSAASEIDTVMDEKKIGYLSFKPLSEGTVIGSLGFEHEPGIPERLAVAMKAGSLASQARLVAAETSPVPEALWVKLPRPHRPHAFHPWRTWDVGGAHLRLVLGLNEGFSRKFQRRFADGSVWVCPYDTLSGERRFGFWVLPFADRLEEALEVERLMVPLDAHLVEHTDAKNHFSSRMNYDREGWERHFGANLAEWRRMKSVMDPHGVFEKGGIDV